MTEKDKKDLLRFENKLQRGAGAVMAGFSGIDLLLAVHCWNKNSTEEAIMMAAMCLVCAGVSVGYLVDAAKTKRKLNAGKQR